MTGYGNMRRVMEVIIPERVQAKSPGFEASDEAGVLRLILGNQNN